MAKDIGGNETVFVECGSQLGRFNISETTFATIKDLHFIGCGCNRVRELSIKAVISWKKGERYVGFIAKKVGGRDLLQDSEHSVRV